MDGDITAEKREAGLLVTAENIELPTAEETIKEFIASVEKRFCPNCGRAVTDGGLGRKRVFCSDVCRVQWWNRARAVRRNAAGTAAAETEV